MSHEERCPHCDASIVKYKHSLNAGMVKGLILLDMAGGRSKFADLKLTFNQKSNFQKLRYWGLIFQDEPRSWALTEKGYKFLANKLLVPKRVTTYRGEAVQPDAPPQVVNIEEVLGDHAYWYKNDYLANRSAKL